MIYIFVLFLSLLRVSGSCGSYVNQSAVKSVDATAAATTRTTTIMMASTATSEATAATGNHADFNHATAICRQSSESDAIQSATVSKFQYIFLCILSIKYSLKFSQLLLTFFSFFLSKIIAVILKDYTRHY